MAQTDGCFADRKTAACPATPAYRAAKANTGRGAEQTPAAGKGKNAGKPGRANTPADGGRFRKPAAHAAANQPGTGRAPESRPPAGAGIPAQGTGAAQPGGRAGNSHAEKSAGSP